MAPTPAGRSSFLGLALTTLSTLMLQILITRIFSVTLWYHFAFMAVSIAMFGLTLGATIVYVRPERFPPDRTQRQMSPPMRVAVGVDATRFRTHVMARIMTSGSGDGAFERGALV